MFIGHYAVALAAKRAAPRVSLGTLFAAAQLADLIWPILLLLGVETVRVRPDAPNSFLTLEFTSYPWTHSLTMALVWGLVAAVAYGLWRANGRGAVVVGLLVVSHWALDWLVHLADLPLYPGGTTRVGLGLWESVAGTVALEIGMFVAGVVIYLRTTRATDRTGSIAFGLLASGLLGLYVSSMSSPPPPSAQAIGWYAMAGWLLPLLAWWIDRHRAVRAPAAA